MGKKRVDITLAVMGDSLQVTIDDDGSGLEPSKRAEVFQRGKRLDEMIDGSGLGLSIVAEHVRLYGGSVDLAESPRGGLRVCLVLPLVPLT